MDDTVSFTSSPAPSTLGALPGTEISGLSEFPRLVESAEQQQTWIKLLCDRVSRTMDNSAQERELRRRDEIELCKLEASVGVMTKINYEAGEKLRYATKEAESQRRKGDAAVTSLQEEIREIQRERIAVEVEAKRHASELELNFEKIVVEKENENATLRQLYTEAIQELEDLKQRLEIEKATVRGLTNRQRAPLAPELDFTLPLLHALWQVTSEPSQASQALQGSPKLLEAIYTKLEAWKPNSPENSLLEPGKSTEPVQPSQTDEIWQVLPSVCGILVNVASSTDGRKAVIRAANGGLLRQILRALEWIQKGNEHGNRMERETEELAEVGVFNRTNTKNRISSRLAQETPENINNTVELLLCVVSNICAEKIPAISMIQAGLFDTLKMVVLVEKKESLRRYAVSIVKATMAYIPEFHDMSGKGSNRAGKQIDPIEIYKLIGDIISSLSHNKALKMIGLDLLGELQRIMPMED